MSAAALFPTPAAAAPAAEALAGLVERVTYHNPENGFSVLRLNARSQRDLVTLVGHTATITAGEWVLEQVHGGAGRTAQGAGYRGARRADAEALDQAKGIARCAFAYRMSSPGLAAPRRVAANIRGGCIASRGRDGKVGGHGSIK